MRIRNLASVHTELLVNYDESYHFFGLHFLCKIKMHKMFLKICFSTKCYDSGNQVILVSSFRKNNGVWLSLFILSSFGGHSLKAFFWDRQENHSALLQASYLFEFGVWLAPKLLPCICVFGMSRKQTSTGNKEIRCRTDYNGRVCTWLVFSMGSMLSLINFAFNIFRKWFNINIFLKVLSASQI